MFSLSSVRTKIASFFSAHPVLKHLISAIQVSIILLFTFYLVYNITIEGYELQELMSLQNAVCVIIVLATAIFWVSKPGIYRTITGAGLLCVILFVILAPSFLRARASSPLTGCVSHLKNIGIAMEMFSSDHNGHYPKCLAEITPRYLKTLPTCPDGRKMSYSYVSIDSPDIYTVWCNGNYHIRTCSINMPEYDSLEGLREK